MIAAEPDAAPHATGTITQAPSLDAAEKTGKSFLPLAWRSRGKLPVHSSLARRLNSIEFAETPPDRKEAIPLEGPAICSDDFDGLAAKLAKMSPAPTKPIKDCAEVKQLGFCNSNVAGEKAMAAEFCAKTCEVCHGNLVPFAGKLCKVGLVRSASKDRPLWNSMNLRRTNHFIV